jgi:hypothetical protein
MKQIWTINLLVLSLSFTIISCSSKSEKQNENYSSNALNINDESSSSNYLDEESNHSSSESNDVTIIKDKDCSNAYSAADDAYSYCKKAYNSDEWEDVNNFLKKAMSRFEEAMTYAQDDDCSCDEAYSSLDDGYSYAKKGYSSDDWDEIKNYAKKAKNSAEDAMTHANYCNE